MCLRPFGVWNSHSTLSSASDGARSDQSFGGKRARGTQRPSDRQLARSSAAHLLELSTKAVVFQHRRALSPRVDDVSMVVSNIEMKNIFMELRPSATKKVLRQIVKRIGKINGSWRKNF